MATSRRGLRATTFGLALIMAFPWPLALSAGNPLARLASVRPQAQLDEANHHLQLSGRSSDWIPPDCFTLALVINAAESDDTCSVNLDLAPTPVPTYAIFGESPAFLPSIAVERPFFPWAQRLRLRC